MFPEGTLNVNLGEISFNKMNQVKLTKPSKLKHDLNLNVYNNANYDNNKLFLILA